MLLDSRYQVEPRPIAEREYQLVVDDIDLARERAATERSSQRVNDRNHAHDESPKRKHLANRCNDLLGKNGADSVDVYLCPKSFLDDMGMSFDKGDEIALTGSKVKQGETDVFLAREIVKGSNDTFSLRDGKGEPVWSWKH